jgi:hypothetical protein
MKSKSIFKSKTALAAAITALTGAIGTISPTVGQVVQANASLILVAVGAANIALRFVTKGKVSLVGEP